MSKGFLKAIVAFKGRNSILFLDYNKTQKGFGQKTPPLAPNKKAKVATIESDDNGPMTREQPCSTARCAAKHRQNLPYDFWLGNSYAWLKIRGPFKGFLISGAKEARSTLFENYSKCLILAFSTNFCPNKIDLSGNTVWPQASGFQKIAKMDHFWHF